VSKVGRRRVAPANVGKRADGGGKKARTLKGNPPPVITHRAWYKKKEEKNGALFGVGKVGNNEAEKTTGERGDAM